MALTLPVTSARSSTDLPFCWHRTVCRADVVVLGSQGRSRPGKVSKAAPASRSVAFALRSGDVQGGEQGEDVGLQGGDEALEGSDERAHECGTDIERMQCPIGI